MRNILEFPEYPSGSLFLVLGVSANFLNLYNPNTNRRSYLIDHSANGSKWILDTSDVSQGTLCFIHENIKNMEYVLFASLEHAIETLQQSNLPTAQEFARQLVAKGI